MIKLFIIDDDEDILYTLDSWFSRKGYAVQTFTGPAELMDALSSELPDMMLLDVGLSGHDGRQVCCYLKSEMKLQVPIVLISASPFNLDNYRDYHADGCIEKPYRLKQLEEYVSLFVNYDLN